MAHDVLDCSRSTLARRAVGWYRQLRSEFGGAPEANSPSNAANSDPLAVMSKWAR